VTQLQNNRLQISLSLLSRSVKTKIDSPMQPFFKPFLEQKASKTRKAI
jgi:hypothetical protein